MHGKESLSTPIFDITYSVLQLVELLLTCKLIIKLSLHVAML